MQLVSAKSWQSRHQCFMCIMCVTCSIGNGALAELVAGRGWQRYLSNLLLPEDVIVQLTSKLRTMYHVIG